jgi:hypothetical protein
MKLVCSFIWELKRYIIVYFDQPLNFFVRYEPALGLTHSPKAFAEGVERGTRSMLSKTVYGVAKSASEITGSIGNVTAQLSFDPKYIETRERERKQQAQHVGEGLA